MSISRRGLLAAGLAVAVVGTLGVVSTMNAGAAENPAAPAVSADSPPPVLPWGAKPHPLKKGARGASSKALARSGASAADSSVKAGSVNAFGPKGQGSLRSSRTSVPPLPPTKAAKADETDADYLYVKGEQDASPDAIGALLTVSTPKVAPEDWHSLAEVTMQSADQQQVVEIGWNVDPATNGDSSTHLFVYHWVNGKESCYNTCDFVPYAGATIAPGATLPTGVLKSFGIQHYNNAWWVAYDSEWIGKFPDSVWGGTFTQAGLVQVFGEVAASSLKPCTQMGNGVVASEATSAKISSLTYTNGPPVLLRMSSSSDVYSLAPTTDRTFHFGGPGAC